MKAYIHKPKSWLGSNLSPASKNYFQQLKKSVKDFVNDNNAKKLLLVIDSVDSLRANPTGMDILSETVEYIRISHLSNDYQVVINSVILADALIKNCGTPSHICFGTKRFLGTLSQMCRKWLNTSVSATILDAMQGWGEGFESRKHLFPEFCNIYAHLRKKTKIIFPRNQYDPHRVPIFLDTINEVDKRLILRYKHDVDEGSGQYGDNDEFFHDTDLVDTTTSNFPTRELPAFLEACRKAESLVEVIPADNLVFKKQDSSNVFESRPQDTKNHSHISNNGNLTIFDAIQDPFKDLDIKHTPNGFGSVLKSTSSFLPFSEKNSDTSELFPMQVLHSDCEKNSDFKQPPPPPPRPKIIASLPKVTHECPEEEDWCGNSSPKNYVNYSVKHENSKVAHLPASDKKNEIKYFGAQRVVRRSV